MGFKDYFIPKSMVYTGDYQAIKTEFKVYQYTPEGMTFSNTYDLSTLHKKIYPSCWIIRYKDD